MMAKRFRSAVVAVSAFCCLLVFSGRVSAQSWAGNVEFRLDRLSLSAAGADLRVGDVVTLPDRAEFGPLRNDFFYGAEYEPIWARLGDDTSVAWGIRASRGRWRAFANGWLGSFAGSTAGRAESQPVEGRIITGSFVESRIVRGVKIWGHSLPPLVNSAERSGLSPMEFYGGTSTSVRKTDLGAEYGLVNSRRLRFGVTGGVSFGRFENRRSEGLGIRAYFDHDFANPGRPLSPWGWDMVSFENQVNLGSTGESKVGLVGPSFGAIGEVRLGLARIEFRANQAFMFGSAEREGHWSDVDDIREVWVFDRRPVVRRTRMDGNFPYSSESRVVVPVLDAAISADVRVAGPVHVGAGYFLSRWSGAPMAPAWSIPGNWDRLGGSGWVEHRANPVFHGASVFVRLGG